jgi:hypothetical protein
MADAFTPDPMRLTVWQRVLIRNDWWLYPILRWWRDWPMRIAWWLPRDIALWAFIRVYAADGDGPGPDYAAKYDYWVRQGAVAKGGRGTECEG